LRVLTPFFGVKTLKTLISPAPILGRGQGVGFVRHIFENAIGAANLQLASIFYSRYTGLAEDYNFQQLTN